MTQIEYTPESVKELSKLDRQTAKRIREYMGEVEKLPDPRSRGKALASNLAGLWRYRVGDYRVISSITENETDENPKQIIITVLVVHVGHRKKCLQVMNNHKRERGVPPRSLYVLHAE